MKFIKDILFVEVAPVGPDAERDGVVQIAAVLLDKDNLLEKSSFSVLIRTTYLESQLVKQAALYELDPIQLKRSPKQQEALRQFALYVGSGAMLAVHDAQTLYYLRGAFKKAAVQWPFDPHVISLWTLGYVYTLTYGMKKLPTFDTFLEYFRVTRVSHVDTMEKTRLLAEVFRKIVKGG